MTAGTAARLALSGRPRNGSKTVRLWATCASREVAVFAVPEAPGACWRAAPPLALVDHAALLLLPIVISISSSSRRSFSREESAPLEWGVQLAMRTSINLHQSKVEEDRQALYHLSLPGFQSTSTFRKLLGSLRVPPGANGANKIYSHVTRLYL